MRLMVRLILVVSFTALFAVPAFAQTSNATLSGTIVDTGGGVLPGVTVKLQSPATGLARDSVTNAAGVYVFNFLPAGEYVVTAELAGFKTLRQPDVRLEIGQSRVLDLKMEVGQLEEVVTVEGTAPLLDRTSASIGTVIQASQLKELPLAGRHWAGLMLLAPGDQHGRRHASQHALRRPRARRQQLDVRRHRRDGREGSAPGQRRAPDHQQRVDRGIPRELDALFRRVGTAAGGVVQLISKTGTNKFRGTAFDFVRNDRFDARPFGTVGEMPPFNQFGFNTGGPIVSQRTFFFANYEGIRQRQTRSFTRQVPSAAFRAGVTGVLAPVVALFPAGTQRTSNADIDDWQGTEEVTNDENAAMFRVDHRFSDNASLFARYNFDVADLVNPADTGVTTNYIRPSNFTVQFQRIFGGNLVSETKFGYNQSNRRTLDTGPSPVEISITGSRR